MPSLYAQYLLERTNDLIIENDSGFATYRYLTTEATKSVYIIDIYMIPTARKMGLAAKLADQIASEARDRGCVEMLGSVSLTAKNATTSLRILLAYGMELVSTGTDFLVLRKAL